ncbi:MAG: IS982 family transposase [Alphaproteobacteria bacterium]|nr:IS982 family transposase [Alphaproteobacteria bacterium]
MNLDQIRKRGERPSLSDSEVITLEVAGEYLGHNSDKAIWAYFKTHWTHFFPKISCRTSFSRQCANLYAVKKKLQHFVSDLLSTDQDLYLCDGFPIPLCHIRRYKRSKTDLRTHGSVGYCATKDEYYFGFKGHIMITQQGSAVAYDIAQANVDERDMVPELAANRSGMLLADKGLIRPELKALLTAQGLDLQTPLRKNMPDSRPKEIVSTMMNIRRKVETVIGQLSERFRIQSIKAKDLWHLCAKVGRKILAHTVCFMFNKVENPDQPLALELLIG